MSAGDVFPTYIPELDQKILSVIADADLFRACNTNSYIANMCDDEIFWRNRTKTRYAMLIKFKSLNTTWKIFYRRLVDDAVYIVDTRNGKSFVYSNVTDAYNKLWDEISRMWGMPVETVRTMSFPEYEEPCTIRLAFKNEIRARDDEFVLYDHRTPMIDILQYPILPSLNVKDRLLLHYIGIRHRIEYDAQRDRIFNAHDETPHNEFCGVSDYNKDTLHSFMTYTPSYALDYPHKYVTGFVMLTMDTGDAGTWLNKFKYGYMIQPTQEPISNKILATFMVDESLFGRPVKFKIFQFIINGQIPSFHEMLEIKAQIEQYYRHN
jgi:hypothetical protein